MKRVNTTSRIATRLGAVCCAVAALFAVGARAAIIEVTGYGELVTDYGINYDYSQNSFVDSADFVIWRNNLGPGSLPNENGVSPGFINTSDYTLWRSRFGTNTFYTHKQTTDSDQNARRSTKLQAINEQQNVTLSVAIQTNNPPYEQAVVTDPQIGWEKPGTPIPAGQAVNSHYIWLNSPTGVLSHDIATFKFDGPILGLIGGPAQLLASNSSLGFDTVDTPNGASVSYTPTPSGFVNEPYAQNPADPPNGIPYSGDVVQILAPDTLQVDFTSFSGDYVRVVTAASGSGGGYFALVPEPATWAQFIWAAIGAIALRCRRR